MKGFTDDQMKEAIEKNLLVKGCYEEIKATCQKLQTATNCPDEDIDNFLSFLIGKWHD